MSVRVRLLLFTVALAALTALAVSCAINPATGRREFSLVSADQELQIGKDGFGAIVAEYGAYDDPGMAAYVDSIGQSLARVSPLPTLAWKFTVLDDPVVNAFAMPGGYIYVTRGILAHLSSEAQLAGVLGHEIGHVTARHTAQRITYQQLAGLGLGLASAFSEGFRRYSGAAEQALGLVFLKYGRDDENQADDLGVTYATAAGWDSREVPGTYTTLKRVGERAGQRLPVFLSTHPDPGDREVRTRSLAMKATQGKTGLQVRGRDYLRRLDGMVFGDDPRQGYFEAGRFYHPQMGFEMEMPAGWTTRNTRSAVMAQAPEQRAAMQLSLASAPAGTTPEQYVSQLRSGGRIQDAAGRTETVGGWPAWVGRVAVPDAQGTTGTLALAVVRQAPDRLFQFIGQYGANGAADEATILAAVRSLRPLADPRRANPAPARLRVKSATASGAFEAVITKLGPTSVSVDDLAILNGVENDEDVRSGQLLKTVETARLK
jgi:predicted Zn-dependent protease